METFFFIFFASCWLQQIRNWSEQALPLENGDNWQFGLVSSQQGSLWNENLVLNREIPAYQDQFVDVQCLKWIILQPNSAYF